LIDQHKKDQLKSALNRVKAAGATPQGESLSSIARSTDNDSTVDERALAMTQAVFEGSLDDAKYAEYISNPDLRAILKAGAKLSNDDLAKIRKIMESLYPDEFK
jgi:hypothetical protein